MRNYYLKDNDSENFLMTTILKLNIKMSFEEALLKL